MHMSVTPTRVYIETNLLLSGYETTQYLDIIPGLCFPHCMCIRVTHKHPGNEANYLHYSLSCQWNHDHYSFITNLKKTQKDFLRSLSERFSFVQHHLTLG